MIQKPLTAQERAPDSVSLTIIGDRPIARSSRKVFSRVAPSIAAIFFYLCLNLIASFGFPSLFQDLFAWQNHSICWWTVKNFRESTGQADVLLVGSSLMCRVVNEGDATYLNHCVNGIGHHQSRYLENKLSNILATQRGGSMFRHYRSISLAVGGMNASDVAAIVPPLMTREKKPSAIVYGIGPRDLFDNSLESAAHAPAFRLAEKMQELDTEFQQHARPGREAQFKFRMNRILHFCLPVYQHQDELSIAFRRQAKAAIDQICPKPAMCSVPPLSLIEKAQLHLVADDVENWCLVKPDDHLHPDRFDFNNNYYLSYNPFKPALYNHQLFFLDRFLKFSQQNGIKVIMVKMPLRQDNFSLMVPNFYNIYSRDIDRLAAASGAVVVDPAALTSFTDDDFTDTVHMTGKGSCKLIDTIAPIVARWVP
jgi:Protein of unknown function (DUF1574)